MRKKAKLATHGTKEGGPLCEVGVLQIKSHGDMSLDGDGGVGLDEDGADRIP